MSTLKVEGSEEINSNFRLKSSECYNHGHQTNPYCHNLTTACKLVLDICCHKVVKVRI